jgi:choice-of-anchor A domain-containing protein
VSSQNLRAATAAILAVIIASPATAGILGVAGDFNGFVFGNLNSAGQDTEGRLAVGGNFTASNYGVGVTLTNSHGTRDDLVVGGNMNAIGAWQVFNGNAVWGASLTASPTTPNGNTHQGTPVDFAAAQAYLTAKSAYWGSLAATGTSVLTFSTLTITGTNPGLNVFQVAQSDWQNSSDKQIHIPVGATALINIAGTSISYQGGLALNGSSSAAGNPALPGVLYNFPNATSISNNNIALLGSLLAPLATLTINGGNIDGNGIALNVIQQNGGEFHNFTFTGDLPSVPVPEPGTFALLLLGAVALISRRVRQ